jgi:hypothetical protein
MKYKFVGYQSQFRLQAIQSFVNCKTMEDMFKAKYCMHDFMSSKSRLIDLIKPEKQIQGRSWPNPIYGGIETPNFKVKLIL